MSRKYRSKLEENIGAALGEEWQYEPFKTSYVTMHTYTPDFVFDKGDWQILVEVKGYFRPGDTQKYKAIRNSLMDERRALVFFLQYPNKKVRKNAQLTMSKWCDKENILWVKSVEELEAMVN